jgi:hypothetical protein
MAQSASESGVLFSLKSQAIVIAQTTLVRGIQNVLAEMGAAYAVAAKAKYAGVERVFTKPDGTVIKINEVIALPTGDIGIKNDVSSLQAVDTLVKMGPDSPNSRFERRTLAFDVLNKVGTNPLIMQKHPEIYLNVLKEMLDTIDWADSAGAGIKDAMDRALKQTRAEAEAAMAPPQPPPGMGGPPAPGGMPPAPPAGGLPPPDLSALMGGAPPPPPAGPPAPPESPLSASALAALAPLMGR